MRDALTVHLNEDGPQSVRVPQSFETAGDFDVVFQNHGSALHVHVRLDPTLSEVATVTTPNRYVDADATRRVGVEVDAEDRPVEGRLEVVTGYGSNTGYVSVTIQEPGAGRDTVAVDEQLAKPRSPPPDSGVDHQRVMLVVFTALALVLVVLSALLSEDILVTIGVLVVLVAIGAVGVLLAE